MSDQPAEDRAKCYDSLASTQCPACYRKKKKRESFCAPCYRRLPPTMQKKLYATVGYVNTWTEAIKMLKGEK